MKMLKIYEYKGCDTCRKALKFLDARGISYDRIPIREKPPTLEELKRMLGHLGGDFRKLFNTSGGDYKDMGLKDKLASMTEKEALTLLNSNGNLVKRPFVISESAGWVGFKEDVWTKEIK